MVAKDNTKKRFEAWLQSDVTRNDIIFVCWRMALRKLPFISHEMSEWHGPREIVAKRYFLPAFRAIFVSRFIASVGSDGERMAAYGQQATRFIDEADFEDGATGAVILAQICQLAIFTAWARRVDHKRICRDVFSTFLSLDDQNENYAEDVFADLDGLTTGRVGDERLFCSEERRAKFRHDLHPVRDYFSKLSADFGILFDWIDTIVDGNVSLGLEPRRAHLFDFSVASMNDDHWRGRPDVAASQIRNLAEAISAEEPSAEIRQQLQDLAGRQQSILLIKKHEFFISHAGPDKPFARRLAKLLQERGCSVWFDETEISVGDSLRENIDRGITDSKYGVLILSEDFFNRPWPKRELDGIFAKETSVGRRIIIPILRNLSIERLTEISPMLAARLALDSSRLSLQQICSKLEELP